MGFIVNIAFNMEDPFERLRYKRKEWIEIGHNRWFGPTILHTQKSDPNRKTRMKRIRYESDRLSLKDRITAVCVNVPMY